MSIFVIGDLHLSFQDNKPMNIFGEIWEKHESKIKSDWLRKVKDEDTVILAGDFSWSMYLNNTYKDFEFLNSLPGKKILLKGNHDYWWTTVTNMKKFLEKNEFENIEFLYNNFYEIEDKIIVGTRGWNICADEHDKKMQTREALRLEMSIKKAIESCQTNTTQMEMCQTNTSPMAQKEIIAIMHYPPIYNKDVISSEPNEFIKSLMKYNVKRCYYGHLHGNSIKEAVEGEYFGIEFKLISADSLNFELLKIN